MSDTRETTRKMLRLLMEAIEDGATTERLEMLAAQARRHLKATGTYQKQYATTEERVLNRHLNLYKNKMDKAATPSERAKWYAKMLAQKEKIAGMAADLDGL